MKRQKRFHKERLGEYEITVRDYGYKSRAPVGVLVSGLTLGECKNPSGDPCYFFKSADAFSMDEGIHFGRQIAQQAEARRIPAR